MELYQVLQEASTAVLNGHKDTAAQKYTVALALMSKPEYQNGRINKNIVQYMLCTCLIDSTDVNKLLHALEELTKIEENIGACFPAIYYTLAKVFLKLYRFDLAQEAVNKGFAFLNKDLPLQPFSLPGSSYVIQETKREDLLQGLIKLKDECSEWHPPDAKCDMIICRASTQHYNANRNIYFSDPTYDGIVIVTCSNITHPCTLTFHQVCWNYLKQTCGTNMSSHKDMLGQPCLTPHCVTNNVPNVIVQVKIFDRHGKIESTIEEPATLVTLNLRHTTCAASGAFSKTFFSELRRLQPQQHEQCLTEEGVAKETYKEDVENLTKHNSFDNMSSEKDWRLMKLGKLRDGKFGISPDRYWIPNKEMYGNEYMLATMKFLPDPVFTNNNSQMAQLKTFLFGVLYEYIKANGPVLMIDILKKWSEAKAMLQDNGINDSAFGDILLQSPKVVQVGNYMCIPNILPITYQVLKFNIKRQFDDLYKSQKLQVDYASDDADTLSYKNNDEKCEEYKLQLTAHLSASVDPITNHSPCNSEQDNSTAIIKKHCVTDNSKPITQYSGKDSETNVLCMPSLTTIQAKENNLLVTESRYKQMADVLCINEKRNGNTTKNEKKNTIKSTNLSDAVSDVDKDLLEVPCLNVPNVRRQWNPFLETNEEEVVSQASLKSLETLNSTSNIFMTSSMQSNISLQPSNESSISAKEECDSSNLLNRQLIEEHKTLQNQHDVLLNEHAVLKLKINNLSQKTDNEQDKFNLQFQDLKKEHDSLLTKLQVYEDSFLGNILEKYEDLEKQLLQCKSETCRLLQEKEKTQHYHESVLKEKSLLINELEAACKSLHTEIEAYISQLRNKDEILRSLQSTHLHMKQEMLQKLLYYQFLSHKTFITGNLDKCLEAVDIINTINRILQKTTALPGVPDNAEWLQAINGFHEVLVILHDQANKLKIQLDSKELIETMEYVELPLPKLPNSPHRSVNDAVAQALMQLHTYHTHLQLSLGLQQQYALPNSTPVIKHNPIDYMMQFNRNILTNQNNLHTRHLVEEDSKKNVGKVPSNENVESIAIDKEHNTKNETAVEFDSTLPNCASVETKEYVIEAINSKLHEDHTKRNIVIESVQSELNEDSNNETVIESAKSEFTKNYNNLIIQPSENSELNQFENDKTGTVKCHMQNNNDNETKNLNIEFLLKDVDAIVGIDNNKSAIISSIPETTSKIDNEHITPIFDFDENLFAFRKVKSNENQSINCDKKLPPIIENSKSVAINNTSKNVDADLSVHYENYNEESTTDECVKESKSLDKLMQTLRHKYTGIMDLDLFESIIEVRRAHNFSLTNIPIKVILKEAEKYLFKRQEKYLCFYDLKVTASPSVSSCKSKPLKVKKKPLAPALSFTTLKGMQTKKHSTAPAASSAKSKQNNGHSSVPKTSAWNKIPELSEIWTKDSLESECIICMENMRSRNDSVYTLTCQHSFHKKCIKAWFMQNQSCPTCRIHCTIDEEYPPLPC